MILHPAVLALFIASLLTSCMVSYAGWHGIRILTGWDIRSGSELQLSLERRTYLISTILSYTLAFQVLSLFLFIFTADQLHGLFAGAMCAAGTLNVNRFGYPLLVVKIVSFMLAGIWLIINHADTRGYDYPLIKVKYTILLAIIPLVVLEFFLQAGYFTRLHADVITSCCGSLFSLDRPGIAGDLAGLPGRTMAAAFYAGMGATFGTGLYYCARGRGVYLFSFVSTATFAIAIAALIAFFCLYFYELPTHHCPFCILQKEYGFVGYPLYLTLLGGGLAGMGTGVLMPFRNRGTMARIIPPLQRQLTAAALSLYLVFTLIVSYRLLFSPFRLGE
ncbi:MAG TPA: hypothetical protein VK187_12360 [Geobacteraceae bacterium]|nr:hypothetical protein [Geobacteraceae bacterium]